MGKTNVRNLHQRSPYAMQFEDRSNEETERQQRCARSKAWNLAKKQIQAQRERPSYILLARGGMGTPDSAELETMRTSRSPTTVMTAIGEAQTRVEATENVKQLDPFVTVMFLEETPAVLSLGKLCADHGIHYHWTSGQKPHLAENGKRIDCTISNYVPFVVPGLTASSSSTALSPTSPSSSSQDSVFGVNRCRKSSTRRSGSTSEELRGDPLHESTETETRCLITKITRFSCRRRTGTVVARAKHFGDLMKADHTILSKGSESRNNHRYAVVVQDLATQWIQSYPC